LAQIDADFLGEYRLPPLVPSQVEAASRRLPPPSNPYTPPVL